MNSQAPILMSAETAWPRRPTPRKTPYTSPQSGDLGVPEVSTSFGLANPPSPSLRDDEDKFEDIDNSTSLVRRETPRWKKNLDPTSRLDPQKIARIAQAFGVNLSLPQSRSLDSHSPLLSSLALPLPSHGGHSQQRSISSNSSVLTAYSAGPITHAPSPHSSPTGSIAYTPLFPRRAVSKPRHLICVSPPASLKSRYPQALLLLQPTHKSQLEVIAREYRLPTTVGLILFLVIDTPPSEERTSRTGMSQGKKHRPKKTKIKIGQDSWGLVWGDVFDGMSTYHHHSSDGDNTGSPKSAKQSLSTPHLKPLAAVSSHSHSPDNIPHTNSSSHISSATLLIGHTEERKPAFSRLSPNRTNTPPMRLASPGKSLLYRSPSSLSPASLTKRKKTPVSLSRQPANRTPSSAFDTSDSAAFSSSSQVAQPLIASHFLAPPAGEESDKTSNFKPPELRIVGSLEFGIDIDRAGEWWDAWTKKKGIPLDVRDDEVDSEEDEENVAFSDVGVQASSAKFSKEDRENDEPSSFEDSFDEEDGYAPLEDESEQKHEEEEKEIDDLLERMLPSDELEWSSLRDSRNPSSAFGKRKGDLQLSAEELSLHPSSSFNDMSRPIEGAYPEAAGMNEFVLNAREVNSILAAHPIHSVPSPEAREGSATRRPKNINLTLDLDSTAGVFTTLLNPTGSPPAASLILGSSSRMNVGDSHSMIPRGEPDSILSPMSDASGVELAYLKRRPGARPIRMRGSSDMEMRSSSQTNPFEIRDDDEVGNRGSALLMHDKLNDLENILRSLSPRDLSIPSRSHNLFPSLAEQTDQALLSPARIDASDPMDRAVLSDRINPSSVARTPYHGTSNGVSLGSIQNTDSNARDFSSRSTNRVVSTIIHNSPFDESSKNLHPVQLPRASSHRSIEDTDSLSVVSHHSERPWVFPREKDSSHDLPAESTFDLSEHVGSSDTSSSPFPSPQRPRMSSSKSSKGFRGFRWGRSSEDASPPLPAEISAPIMTRPELPVGSNAISLSGSATDINDHYRYGDSSSSLISQFGQRIDITPDMSSSGFGESINLPSPTSPKDGRGSVGNSSRKRFKAPFSPGQLFGSKSHKNRPPMEISAPELISINNQASNGSPGMTAFHHRSKSELEGSQGMKGSPSMQALQRQQQQHPSKHPFIDGLQSPPTSPNSVSSPSSPRTVRRKPVPGIPSYSPSIASLSRQMHRMSSASEESAFSPRLGTSTSSGTEPFTLAPPLPDSPLKTVGLGAQTDEAEHNGPVVGLGFTRPSYVMRPGLDEDEGLA